MSNQAKSQTIEDKAAEYVKQFVDAGATSEWMADEVSRVAHAMASEPGVSVDWRVALIGAYTEEIAKAGIR